MGIIKNQTFQSSILLYIGTLVGFLTTGMMAPNLLTQSEIGTTRLLMSYSGILAGIGVLGFHTVTIRFIPEFREKSINKRYGFFGISILVGLVGFLLTWLIIALIKAQVVANNVEKSPEFAEYFFLIIPLTLFQIYYSLFDFYNSALYRSSYGVFLRDFIQRVFLFVGLLLIMLHFFSFAEYIYFYVISICLPTVLMLMHLAKHEHLDLSINRSVLNKPVMSSMASVAFFGFINSTSHAAILQIDGIMVNQYLDSAAVGIYTITAFFGLLVLIPSKAFNRISPTVISNAFKDNDLSMIKSIYYKGCRSLFIIGSLIVLGLLVNLDNIFYLIPRSYEAGKLVIVYIAFANLIKMAGGTNDSIINYSQYYKLSTIFILLLAGLIILFNYILIPRLGMDGAAIAILLSVLIHNVSKTYFIWKKFGLYPYSLQYIVVLILSGVIYLIVSLMPIFENYLLEIMKDSALAGILFILLMWRLPIASDLRTLTEDLYMTSIHYLRKKLN